MFATYRSMTWDCLHFDLIALIYSAQSMRVKIFILPNRFLWRDFRQSRNADRRHKIATVQVKIALKTCFYIQNSRRKLTSLRVTFSKLSLLICTIRSPALMRPDWPAGPPGVTSFTKIPPSSMPPCWIKRQWQINNLSLWFKHVNPLVQNLNHWFFYPA